MTNELDDDFCGVRVRSFMRDHPRANGVRAEVNACEACALRCVACALDKTVIKLNNIALLEG